ncbi:MAG: type II toxin-antitoxin system MqsR family toxin [Terracidiphilus sp.]|jgi:motility quorum-sensing regulator/GCU-specific mRNA interferase toxin
MEKRIPHCQLSIVKKLIREGKVRSTFSALAGAAALGFDFGAMLKVLLDLTMNDFYKSMTTYADHRVWQDVYRPTTTAGEVYMKLTVVDEVLIVSFKEL